MGRRCCDCCAVRTYTNASDWTAEVGGSVADGSTAGTLDIDGEVNPNSFLSTEAWLITFDLESGSVTFTIDSVDYTVDATNQTITAGANTVAIGYTAISTKFTSVELRVTPTHAFLLAYGNYDIGAGRMYGILTVSRSTDVPNSFSCDWSSAELRDFTISDSTVVVSEDGPYGPTYSTVCWTHADVENCPYIIVEDQTSSHLYYGTTNVVQESIFDANIRSVSGDMDMASLSLSITGSNAWFDGSDGRTYDTPFWAFRVTSAIGDTRLSAPTINTLDYRHAETACLGLSEIACWRTSGVADWDHETFHLNIITTGGTGVSSCSRQLTLKWYTPTVADPYPEPYLLAELSMVYTYLTYQSGGYTSAEIAPNDIASGFSLTVAGTENHAPVNSYQFIVGGTWNVL